MIIKNMVSPSSRWAKIRNELEKLYDKHTKDYFLDVITTSYIAKEADMEILNDKIGEI